MDCQFYKDIIEISKGLVAPTIAVVTCYIAYQQWQTNKDKLTLDKYDRRLHVYQSAYDFLTRVTQDLNANEELLEKFRGSIAASHFLFDREINLYLTEIHNNGVGFMITKNLFSTNRDEIIKGNDPNNIGRAVNTELMWFQDQLKIIAGKFERYLKIK
jgi:hypothetical protein